MSARAGGFLLVRVGQRRIGLLVEQVLEVVQLGEVHSVPVMDTAVRGLVAVHGRMLPLVHLASLVEGRSTPVGSGNVGIVVNIAGSRVCLEVEEAEMLIREPALPVPPGETLPWAVGVARHGEFLVPLLDLPALSSRLTEAAAP